MINIGVIGYGYWGPNLVRNFSEIPGGRVTAVCDAREDRLALVRSRYPAVKTVTDPHLLVNDPSLDAVLVATPVSTHFELAMQALKAGKHVLVEKPLTASSEQAGRLIDEASRRKKILMVDHTFVFTGAVRKIKDLLDRGELGDLYYYDSVRVNLGLFQHDVNVVWDLAVHDLSIMDYLLSSKPCAISATGTSHLAGQQENTAYLTFFFDGSLMAHVHVSWLAPVKIRRTLLGGSQKMVVYDDLEPSEKVKIYDKGVSVNPDAESVYQMLVSYRSGDMWAPNLDATEALRHEARHFVRCIEQSRPPLTGGEAGLRVVRMLEAAAESLKQRGHPVELTV